ncbi:hypothetical protein IQ244_22650 [Nostoc sp. LEGE 06077]|nr:hypothetical protein [Nostoc sp. LEGE 06077]
MTQPEIHSSPRFVDFGYEPGTLVLGGMWLNMKIFDLCVYGRVAPCRGEEWKLGFKNMHIALCSNKLPRPTLLRSG